MIPLVELQALSTDRLEDARVLFDANRFDGAFYICGYALELGLKKKICESLRWQGYPHSKKEFDGLLSFKTHDLEMLLHLSGIESLIKEQFLGHWSTVIAWTPETRYSAKKRGGVEVKLILESIRTILEKL